MALKNSIINKLGAKQGELETNAQSQKDAAAFLRTQIKGYEEGAEVSTRQATAVAKALAILNEAEVTF